MKDRPQRPARAQGGRGLAAVPSHRVTKTLWPGQAGTIKLARRFGASLVCVRYRESSDGMRRFTTVETVIDEGPVVRRLADAVIYELTIGWDELELRQLLKHHGARWDAASRAWRLSGRKIKALQLSHRVRNVPIPSHRQTPFR